MQKAVYLAQLSGVDLGYRFSWYLFGPYCSELADVYYSLKRNPDQDSIEGILSESVTLKLTPIKSLISSNPPDELSQTDWLELLASVHYLCKVSHMSSDKALQLMQEQKPKLVPYMEAASKALKSLDMVVC